MTHYAPCYDPPLVADLEAHRELIWSRESDRELFMHVGHFVAWYASAELAITALLNWFTGNSKPSNFHILTRGMDAKVKCERLKEAIAASGFEIHPPLQKRFEHFTKKIVSIRNLLVHSHLYWPEGDKLQMTSVGKPPLYATDPIKNAPKPDMIEGLELFERAVWLQAFSTDLFVMAEWVASNPSHKGILGRGRYLSSLPTGDRPSPTTQSRRANAGKRAQTPPV